ncbi:MAG TPA: hypothetical protein PKX07_13625, partial [Aggregatilineales bacterium]|nr:hypothetical protein [Aggregatilineales bacterium]
VGYDAYKQAMDCLKPGDVVILTTPPGFRWLHFKYAVEKKLNIFMEKPVTVDGPTSKKFLELNKAALAADLKIVVGLMSRHSVSLQELYKRVQDGQLGDIMYMRGYRMHGPAASFESTPKPANMSHLEYQIRRFHSFLWASGGAFNDFYIHHIDHLSWMKNSWPVKAHAVGGRHFKRNNERVEFVDQNFDSYSVEYTYADGSKLFFDGRCMHGARGVFQSFVHGTKGAAIAATADGGVLAVGFSDGRLTQSSGGFDIVLVKYDADFNRAWTQQFGSSDADGADEWAEGNLYLAVSGDTFIVSGLTLGAFGDDTPAGSTDVFLALISVSGE